MKGLLPPIYRPPGVSAPVIGRIGEGQEREVAYLTRIACNETGHSEPMLSQMETRPTV